MMTAILARRRILLAKQSGEVLPTDMVLLINSPNAGDFSVTTNYGTFTAAKVSEYPYFDTTVTHKLSIRDVTFSTGQSLSADSAVRGLFVGVESWGTANAYTNTSALFNAHTNLQGIPASWAGLANVTQASGMFYNCSSLKRIPSSWAGLANVTHASAMFSGCTSLTNCGTIFTGLAMATQVNQLFEGCTGMQGDIHALYVYLSTKPIAVTYFANCFRNCTQAVGYDSIPVSWKGAT